MFDVVTITGLPAFIARAVCVRTGDEGDNHHLQMGGANHHHTSADVARNTVAALAPSPRPLVTDSTSGYDVIRDNAAGSSMISHCVCRVCGLRFPSPRVDAITCTDTCRQRLRRGGTFAYLAGLSPARQRAERKYHDAIDTALAAHRTATAARRKLRDLKRAERQARAERERERMIAEIAGRAYLAVEKRKREQGVCATVAGILTLFERQHRNDMSRPAHGVT